MPCNLSIFASLLGFYINLQRVVTAAFAGTVACVRAARMSGPVLYCNQVPLEQGGNSLSQQRPHLPEAKELDTKYTKYSLNSLKGVL